MTNRIIDEKEEMPQWDVAIESLINEEYSKLGRPLGVEDFQRLGTDYKIRFDDIMATLAQLCLHDEWIFEGEDGRGKTIGREIIEELFPYGRLEERLAKKYAVIWLPR
ncbi:MAG: hypothetical protein FD165_1845 [Gammaproteobacteria bacterium]|nr:MAG: hypothetical protein FD165_1845 [Gammaproteobacteria bacterium]TND04417.1 MAG: hypothetical protein FD120_1531 [Gammaproteobacteria bacterium]